MPNIDDRVNLEGARQIVRPTAKEIKTVGGQSSAGEAMEITANDYSLPWAVCGGT